MQVHGPSAALGGGIAAAAAIAVAASMLALAPAPAGPGGAEPALEPAGEFPADRQDRLDAAALLSALTGNAPPALGSEDAPITLVEFGDYQCHFCNRFFHDTEPDIVENYVDAGLVRLVFKDYTIIGPDSDSAAQAARCAADQGLFWEYHDALYDGWDGENTGWASRDGLAAFASSVAGLDMDEWSACAAGGTHAAAVDASNADARALGLTGTPAFFVISDGGGRIAQISGAQPYEVFAGVFDSELGR